MNRLEQRKKEVTIFFFLFSSSSISHPSFFLSFFLASPKQNHSPSSFFPSDGSCPHQQHSRSFNEDVDDGHEAFCPSVVPCALLVDRSSANIVIIIAKAPALRPPSPRVAPPRSRHSPRNSVSDRTDVCRSRHRGQPAARGMSGESYEDMGIRKKGKNEFFFSLCRSTNATWR